jgi:hypothetical protein
MPAKNGTPIIFQLGGLSRSPADGSDSQPRSFTADWYTAERPEIKRGIDFLVAAQG